MESDQRVFLKRRVAENVAGSRIGGASKALSGWRATERAGETCRRRSTRALAPAGVGCDKPSEHKLTITSTKTVNAVFSLREILLAKSHQPHYAFSELRRTP